MAFVTGFTLETSYELRSDQGSHGLKFSIGYELDGEDDDLATVVVSKAGELSALSAGLHRVFTAEGNGSSAQAVSLRSTAPLDHPFSKRSSRPATETPAESDPYKSYGGESEGRLDPHSPNQTLGIPGPIEPHATDLQKSALEAAEASATTDQVIQIREMLFKDDVADEDFGRELKSRFGKYYPEDLTRLQASTVLFEMRNRERFRSKQLHKSGAT